MPEPIPEQIRATCLKAADCLMLLASQAREPRLMEVCSLGLREYAHQYYAYQSCVKTAAPFIQELAAEVSGLCPGGSHSPDGGHDMAFVLVEALALIMREAVLRKGNHQPTSEQEAVMRYFEQSGHWRHGEGSLVTDYYYTRIPIDVMHSLVASLRPLFEKAPGQV